VIEILEVKEALKEHLFKGINIKMEVEK